MADDDDSRAGRFDALLREVAATPSSAGVEAPARYRVLATLGRGGGGEVYKAYDEQLGRHVALKFLNGVGSEHVTQLVNEARMQARVQHAGVCQVYEVSAGAGRPYIAMQLIDGPTLREAAPAMSRDDKVAVMRQVAEAIDAAHQLGIVHRDLKPANIMLERATDGWRAYVLDFGLAREVDKTLTGSIVGTPQYMAPEQARGESSAVGPGTDVWALGATLYAILADKPPFDGVAMMDILRRVETEEPARLPTVPRELEAIVFRCLQKSPARRYATAGALARDLAAFMRGDAVSARPPSVGRRLLGRARRHRALLLLAVTIIAASVAALAMTVWRPTHAWRPRVSELKPQYDEAAGGVRVSPDGKQLFFESDRSGEILLYLESVDGGPLRLLQTPGQASARSWSSDGRAVYYLRENVPGGHIMRMPLDGSAPPVEVMAADDARECAGQLFFISRNGGVDRLGVRAPDGAARELLRSASRLEEIACSADGQRVVYVRGATRGKVAWIDVRDGIEHALPGLDGAWQPTFHPDGRSVVAAVRTDSGRVLVEQPSDGGPPRALTEAGHEYFPAFTPDGKRLFFNSETRVGTTTLIPIDGGPARPFASGSSNNLGVPTADGRELITSRRRDKHRVEIVALSLSDGSERVLAQGSLPAVSPDQALIYFADDEPTDGVWVVPRQGGPRRLLARVPHEILALDAAPDALHLEVAGEVRRSWRQPYDGSPGAYEGPIGVQLLEPAADGWSLVVSASEHVIIVPPGPWPAVLPPETRFIRPRLTIDRRAFVARDDADGIWVVSLATGAEERVARSSTVHEVGLSSDGKTIYAYEVKQRDARAELTNYAELPRP